MRVRMMAGLAGLILAGSLANSAQAAFSANGLQKVQTNTQTVTPNPTNATADDDEAGIPNNAVRLRIIANSDSPEDQALKRKVRDRIIDEVGKRLRGVETQEQARTTISGEVPKLNEIAAAIVKDSGYSYAVKTDYGRVPFPTKMYGDKVYPAGDYEALRIVIGEGQGQNWWCVLFPPLCFVDLANADAVQAKDMESKPLATVKVPTGDTNTAQTVQVRLGILDLLHSLIERIGHFLKSLFA